MKLISLALYCAFLYRVAACGVRLLALLELSFSVLASFLLLFPKYLPSEDKESKTCYPVGGTFVPSLD